MSNQLKVDTVSPPPARLSAFLHHTPLIYSSFLLFIIVTFALVYTAFLTLDRA